MIPEKVDIIDSHTGGEPTRTVVAGGPDLGTGPLVERVARFREHHDDFRQAMIREPRGTNVLIGALLCPPVDSRCVTGVIYFNNAGYLNMCGHGTIGLVVTLHYLGWIQPGVHRIETPVGVVTTTLHDDLSVSLTNVPSFRYRKSVCLELPDFGKVVGDIVWGGNWFFLARQHPVEVRQSNLDQLMELTKEIRRYLDSHKITGRNGGLIDHIEVFGNPTRPEADSKSFVLCPGAEFDRSPCGTGTSAKVAMLFADGVLQPGETYRQESIIGSLFEASVELPTEDIVNQLNLGDECGPVVVPTITGTAHVHLEATLLMNSADPYRQGIEI